MLGRAYTRRGNLDAPASPIRKRPVFIPDPSYFLSLGRALADSNQDRAMAAYAQAWRSILLTPKHTWSWDGFGANEKFS